MKTARLIFFLLASLMFSGCSIQQYFVLSNATNQTISIKYSLENATSEKVIFGPEVEVYQATRDYFPNWEHKLPIKDLNNSDDNVLIKLGPKSSLVFGTLSNDRYNSISMMSESGKVFNLKEMNFTVNGTDFHIDKDNFNDFFLNEGGAFLYIIQ